MKKLLLLCLFSGIAQLLWSQCGNQNRFASSFTITNTTTNVFINKPVRLVMNTATQISAGQMAANGSDIRVGTACCSLMNFWIDSTTINTTSTSIWVNIPNLAPNASITIKVFHGSTVPMASASNLSSTFLSRYILTSGTDSLLGPVNTNYFEIGSGATLTIRSNSPLVVNADLIRINGTIQGTGRGWVGPKTVSCTAGTGPGAASTYSSCTNGGGGAYGGAGGCAPTSGASSCGGAASIPYGTLSGSDIAQGSSGSAGSSASTSSFDGAGNGGGAITLNGSHIIINGTINMNGADGQASGNSTGGGGGGAGGGILIQGGDLVFGTSSSLTANGGRAGNSYGGCGGGGRIKIFRTGSITGTPVMQANGTNQHTYIGAVLLSTAIGQAGTTYSGVSGSAPITSAYLNTQGSGCGNIYYSKSTGALNDTLSWGKNADGSGANPPNFNGNDVIYNVVNNGSPTINGNWFITGTNTLVIFGDGVNAGNFILPAGTMFGADTFYLNNQMTATINGSLISNKPGYDTGSTVQYTSATPQQIMPGNYGNLIVAGSPKTLSGNVSVYGTLLLVNNLTTGSYNLTIGTSGSRPGALSIVSGYIIGKLTRWIPGSAIAVNPGYFPIGSSTNFIPVQIDFTAYPSTPGTLTAEFVATPPGNGGFPLFDFTTTPIVTLNKTATNGFWRLTPGNGITGGTYNITATANNFWGINNVSDLRLVRRNNTFSSWSITGTSVLGTGNSFSAVVKRNGLTLQGGDFAVASDSSVNSLPVKLIQFDARRENNASIITWATASEENFSGFAVERKGEGAWENLGFVKGKVNSLTNQSYVYRDEFAFATNASSKYYRLQMIDRDGSITYSPVRMVSGDAVHEQVAPSVNPNPFHQSFSVVFSEPVEGNVEITLMNPEGIVTDHEFLQLNAGQQEVLVNTKENLSAGVYFAVIKYNNRQATVKVVKH